MIAIALRCLFLTILAVGLIGCASHNRDGVVPDVQSYELFRPVGMPGDVRVYSDAGSQDTDLLISEFRQAMHRHPAGEGVNLLALSGGGPNGAYGAGVLSGWSQSGRRPRFDVVTGISTGAIIAPFAFLGPDYDEALKRFYTTTNTSQVARFRVLGAMLGGGSLARSQPLAQAINRELSNSVLAAIAREHEAGRRLLIGTTNIDAERPVIWDVGRIASFGTPEAYGLVRKIILASASIPAVFEPVVIPVTDGSNAREELHVDGALSQNVFIYPYGFDMRRALGALGLSRYDNRIWLIQNTRLYPYFEAQDTRLFPTIARTLRVLNRTASLGAIAHVLALARRDGLGVSILSIPNDFDQEPEELFDPSYMSALFQRGVADGLDPESWIIDAQRSYY